MICWLDARRNASPTAVYPIVALSSVALVYVAANRAPGVGLLARLAEVPMLGATLFFAAIWSWWHFAVVAVGQTCLFVAHAVRSLTYLWLFFLVSGCAVLVATHSPESPR